MASLLRTVLLAAGVAALWTSATRAAGVDEDVQGNVVKFYIVRMKEIHPARPTPNEFKSADGSVAIRLTLAPYQGQTAKVRLFKTGTWLPMGEEIETVEPRVYAISPDNKTIAIGTVYGEVNVYDGVTGKKLDKWGRARFDSLRFSEDGKMLKVYCWDDKEDKGSK